MEVISLFCVCVTAGFFLHPLLKKVMPAGRADSDEAIVLMKDSIRRMKENAFTPGKFLKRGKFISKEKTHSK